AWWQGNQQAFGSLAGNGVDVFVADTFRAHELGVHVGLARLAQDQAQLRVVTAVVNEVDVGLFDFGDQRGEVFVTGGNAFEHGHFNAGVFQCVTNCSGDTFTVLLLVVHDRNTLGLLAGDVVASDRTLHAVQADGAEHQFVAALGDLRAGGRRSNHQNTFVFIDVRRRLG